MAPPAVQVAASQAAGGALSQKVISADPNGLEMCGDFRRGKCSRETCRYSHEGGGVGNEECADFRRGNCFRDSCRYMHGGSSGGVGSNARTVKDPDGREVCGDFRRGNCSQDGCRYSHDVRALMRGARSRTPRPRPPSTAPTELDRLRAQIRALQDQQGQLHEEQAPAEPIGGRPVQAGPRLSQFVHMACVPRGTLPPGGAAGLGGPSAGLPPWRRGAPTPP